MYPMINGPTELVTVTTLNYDPEDPSDQATSPSALRKIFNDKADVIVTSVLLESVQKTLKHSSGEEDAWEIGFKNTNRSGAGEQTSRL